MSALPSSSLYLPPAAHASGTLRLPGSKSISNRALLLAALADGTTRLDALLDADDVRYMREALRQLGVVIEAVGENPVDSDWIVQGCGGRFPNESADLFLGNAGTAVRPLTAALAILGGDYRIDGVPRMRERPIGDLVDALRALHCRVEYEERDGFPPLAISRRNEGGPFPLSVPIRGDVSSQFLSALLMALPLIGNDGSDHTEVELTTPLISRPYVAITTHLMARFGVTVATPDPQHFRVPRGVRYRRPEGGVLTVESDASSASYFLAAGVLGGGPVRVLGVGRDAVQGDVAFADVLRAQGATIRYGKDFIEAQRGAPFVGGEIDCLAIPDAAMTLAITALAARAPTTLRNIGSWRVKETDRIAAMANELAKIGARVESGDDWLTVHPCAAPRHAEIDTYDDHRMAMCFSLVSLLGTAVTVRDPGCVAKTFPGYFEAFGALLRGEIPPGP